MQGQNEGYQNSLLRGKIQISVEGRKEVEVVCRKLVREEGAAWRGGRRCLYFFILSVECHSSPIVALQDLEEMKEELLGYSGQ